MPKESNKSNNATKVKPSVSKKAEILEEGRTSSVTVAKHQLSATMHNNIKGKNLPKSLVQNKKTHCDK